MAMLIDDCPMKNGDNGDKPAFALDPSAYQWKAVLRGWSLRRDMESCAHIVPGAGMS